MLPPTFAPLTISEIPMKLLIVLVLSLLVTPSVHAATDADFENMEVVIAPRPHEDIAGYAFDLSDSYYFIKSASRIFFGHAPITAKITNADVSTDKAEFLISSNKFGDGTITVFSAGNLKETPREELKEVLRRCLSNEKISLVVADRTTRKIHVATSNHLPQEPDRLYLQHLPALKEGYSECGVCFSKRLYTPEYGTELTLQKKGEAELRHYNDHLVDPALQSHVDAIGRKILSRWPYPLVGYKYKFTVVQSEEINAYALAAGSIFLTSGLLNSVENDEELEAVMAHEIAHVERQHGLQAYRKAVASQQAQTAVQILGGIATGVAVANNRNTAAGVLGGATVAAILAIRLQEVGFSKEQEKEADEFAIRYFNNSASSLSPLKAVFKKLMYHNLCSRLTPDPSGLTHPALGSRLAALDGEKAIFSNSSFYHLLFRDKPLELAILSITSNKEGAQVVLKVSDLLLFRQLLDGSDEMTLYSGTKEVVLTIDEHVVYTDPWGGMVTAKSKDPLPAMPHLDFLGKMVYINMSNGNHSTTRDPNAYPETRKIKVVEGSYYDH
jgi:Zn-dependent protease with chaperone function